MDKELANYVDAAFAPYGNDTAIQETKEELARDLQEKFKDLKDQGKSDDEARTATISSIGDVLEIIEAHTGKPAPKRKVNISQSNLRGSDLSGTGTHDARFAQTVLKGANLSNSNLTDSTFEKSDLRQAVFDGSDLTGATFAETALANASFKECKFDNTIFKRTDLNNVSFEGQTLVGTVFSDTALKNVSFRNAILRDVSFERARKVKQADFEGATMDKLAYAVLQGLGADLKNAHVID